MVITDDNFATIVSAVEEGRRIYDNIRKGASYLLSVSFAELGIIFLGVMIGLPVPLLAVQILWINVIAEEFPAIGLAVEPAHDSIMNKKPRSPKEAHALQRTDDLHSWNLGSNSDRHFGTLCSGP